MSLLLLFSESAKRAGGLISQTAELFGIRKRMAEAKDIMALQELEILELSI